MKASVYISFLKHVLPFGKNYLQYQYVTSVSEEVNERWEGNGGYRPTCRSVKVILTDVCRIVVFAECSYKLQLNIISIIAPLIRAQFLRDKCVNGNTFVARGHVFATIFAVSAFIRRNMLLQIRKISMPTAIKRRNKHDSIVFGLFFSQN